MKTRYLHVMQAVRLFTDGDFDDEVTGDPLDAGIPVIVRPRAETPVEARWVRHLISQVHAELSSAPGSPQRWLKDPGSSPSLRAFEYLVQHEWTGAGIRLPEILDGEAVCLQMLTSGCAWQPASRNGRDGIGVDGLIGLVFDGVSRLVRPESLATPSRSTRPATRPMVAVALLGLLLRVLHVLFSRIAQAILARQGRAEALRPRRPILKSPVVPRGPSRHQQLRRCWPARARLHTEFPAYPGRLLCALRTCLTCSP